MCQKNRKGTEKCNKFSELLKSYSISLTAKVLLLLLVTPSPTPVPVYLYIGMTEPSDPPIATLGFNGGNPFDYSLRQSAASSNPKTR
jgi:hypothetical protein